jgi:3-deoxy-D-manno-octulosonic-acid transferase
MTKALLEAGGGLMAPNREALTAILEDLLDNPEKARSMGRRAADFVRVHQGGVRKTMDLLRPFLERARRQ